VSRLKDFTLERLVSLPANLVVNVWFRMVCQLELYALHRFDALDIDHTDATIRPSGCTLAWDLKEKLAGLRAITHEVKLRQKSVHKLASRTKR